MLQYLDEYLDTIVSLPNDLQRHYSLLKQLDSSSSNFLSSISRQVELGEESNKAGSPPRSQDTPSSDLKSVLLKQIGIAQQRLAIAKSAQASVEAHVQRLDDDLRHFEEEARLAGVNLPRGHTKPSKVSSAQSGSVSNVVSRKRRDGSGRERHSGTKKSRRRQKEDSEVSNNSDTPHVSSHSSKSTEKKLSKRRKRTHAPPTVDGIYCFCEGPPRMIKTGTGEVMHDMIACDYGRCPYEWFHLDCVGETSVNGDQPWYCPECKDKASRRH
jgi:hypothetical protein